ncbi:MAG TPA: DNA-3-methyladenine glycosylase [Terriglobales bacterium]|jgi:DNA-3-methyladenine glycosylase
MNSATKTSTLQLPAAALSRRSPGQRPGATRYEPLTRSFFNRDPRVVSPELLGKVLVRKEGRKLLVGRIVEVEAYLGADDPAAHSYAGRTARNAVLFGPPGYVYVYFIYGNHYCLNVSCLPDGTAGGILFRAVEPLLGIEEMALARDVEVKSPRDLPKLTSGPGRLAEAFGITRIRDNGKDFTSRKSDLLIADDGFPAPKVQITNRIGITKAVDHPLRFIVAGSPFVSGKKILNSVGA